MEKEDMKNKNNKAKNLIKKWTLRVIFGVLLIITFMAIFKFSSQNGNESKGLSTKVMEKIAEILPVNNNIKEEIIKICEPVLRKVAHFTIYSFVGIWTSCLLSTYKLNNKKNILISITIGFLYACTDELHQSMTPGRGPSFKDVLLDTSGVFYGSILINIIVYAYKNITKTLQKD